MSYCDYAYYVETYQGDAIAQSAFPRLAMRASAVIDQVTFGRASLAAAGTDTALVDALKMATCSVADEIQKLDESGGAVSSERVGNQQVTYLSTKSEGVRLSEAAKLYLWDTGLMYRGLD